MTLKLVLCILFIAMLSCKKDTGKKSASQLLTQKAWTLVSYGYDHNANGLIDATEESTRDCDTDNSFTFNINGTGLVKDNLLSCDNGVSEMSFTWKLTDNETTINFLTGMVTILRLTDEQLIISQTTNSGVQSPRFIETFKH